MPLVGAFLLALVGLVIVLAVARSRGARDFLGVIGTRFGDFVSGVERATVTEHPSRTAAVGFAAAITAWLAIIATLAWRPGTPYPRTTLATWQAPKPPPGYVDREGTCWPRPSITAFGHVWQGETPFPPGVMPTYSEHGTFRQLDTMHGVFTPTSTAAHYAFSFTRFNDLDCETPWDPRYDEKLPMAIQPPNPCRLLASHEVANATGLPVNGSGSQPTLATLGSTSRGCTWTMRVAGRFSARLTLSIITDASVAAARSAGIDTGLLPSQFDYESGLSFVRTDVLGYTAHYVKSETRFSVLTPTTLIVLNVDLQGTVDQRPLSTLAAIALKRVSTTGA
jgi:hypothetical protein